MFEHLFLKERVVKSVIAGLCSVFIASLATNNDAYFSGRRIEPLSHIMT